MDEFNIHEPRLRVNPFDKIIEDHIRARKELDDILGHDNVERTLEIYMEESIAETPRSKAWTKLLRSQGLKALVQEIIKTKRIEGYA